MICKVCGKEFEKIGRNQVICSDACRKKQQAAYMHKYYLKKHGKEETEKIEKITPMEVEAKKMISSLNWVEKERNLLKQLDSIVSELKVCMENHLNEANRLDKETLVAQHELESHSVCPSDEYMIKKGKKDYENIVGRRQEKTGYEALFACCIGSIPKDTEKIYMEKIAFQDKLNKEYEEKKEWNTDNWKNRNPNLQYQQNRNPIKNINTITQRRNYNGN